MKTLALIVRRPDHTREAFRAHYEEIHAPLAMETVMEGTSRYVRYHLAREIFGSPSFDVITAFQYPTPEAAAALMQRLGTDQGARILADEATFMDRARNGFFVVEEHPVLGEEDREAGLSVAVLARAPEGEDSAAFVSRYEAELLPRLLESTREPVWCLQNRAVKTGPAAPPWDLVTQIHARGDAGLAAWAEALAKEGAEVLVAETMEAETETPWS